MECSTLLTIGTALNRARDCSLAVDVLVAGLWLHGEVVEVDGHGLVLASETGDRTVARIEHVAAVRVINLAPSAPAAPDVWVEEKPVPRLPSYAS